MNTQILKDTKEVSKELIQRLMNATLPAYFWRVIQFNHDSGTEMGRNTLTEQEFNKEVDMLQEELDEFKQAVKGLKKVKDKDGTTNWTNVDSIEEQRSEIADAIGDIIYVAFGTAGKLGIDLPIVLDQIAASNETKYDEQGRLVKVNGKIIKGVNFKQPDLSCTKEVIPFSSMINKAIQEAVDGYSKD